MSSMLSGAKQEAFVSRDILNLNAVKSQSFDDREIDDEKEAAYPID
ncbi:hypothetical protein OH784_04195 [Ectobacillus funiculus]